MREKLVELLELLQRPSRSPDPSTTFTVEGIKTPDKGGARQGEEAKADLERIASIFDQIIAKRDPSADELTMLARELHDFKYRWNTNRRAIAEYVTRASGGDTVDRVVSDAFTFMMQCKVDRWFSHWRAGAKNVALVVRSLASIASGQEVLRYDVLPPVIEFLPKKRRGESEADAKQALARDLSLEQPDVYWSSQREAATSCLDLLDRGIELLEFATRRGAPKYPTDLLIECQNVLDVALKLPGVSTSHQGRVISEISRRVKRSIIACRNEIHWIGGIPEAIKELNEVAELLAVSSNQKREHRPAASAPAVAQSSIAPHNVSVKQPRSLGEYIIDLWEKQVSASTSLSFDDRKEMASIAIKAVLEDRLRSEGDRLVHAPSGLELPIAAPAILYCDRAEDEFGRKPSIESWLRNDFWRPYTAHRLVSAGELKKLDNSAYNALYGRAKQMAIKNGKTLADVKTKYFLENGVLSEEIMENPPDGLRIEVELIRKSQALQKVHRITKMDDGRGLS